jgi:hypothetical protein
MERVHVVLIDIVRLAESTPASVGESPQWTEVVMNAAETSRNLHQLLNGKTLCSALHGAYAEALNDPKAALQESAAKNEATTNAVKEAEANEEFREKRRRERNSSNDQHKKRKKAGTPTAGVRDLRIRSQHELHTRNSLNP